MRFTHHAKNRVRLNKLALVEVEAIAMNPALESRDENGNPSYLGYVGTQVFRVIEAADDPGLIITVYPEDRQ